MCVGGCGSPHTSHWPDFRPVWILSTYICCCLSATWWNVCCTDYYLQRDVKLAGLSSFCWVSCNIWLHSIHTSIIISDVKFKGILVIKLFISLKSVKFCSFQKMEFFRWPYMLLCFQFSLLGTFVFCPIVKTQKDFWLNYSFPLKCYYLFLKYSNLLFLKCYHCC